MKSFTTPEYINPILAEIDVFYTPITDRIVTRALNCNVLLQHNHSRNAIAVRAGQPFYYYRGTLKEVYQELRDYAEAAETEPGELDQWRYDEEQRIQHTLRDAILTKYTGRA